MANEDPVGPRSAPRLLGSRAPARPQGSTYSADTPNAPLRADNRGNPVDAWVVSFTNAPTARGQAALNNAPTALSADGK